MAHIFVNGYRVKVSWIDSFLDSILFLWPGDHGQVRRVPRNIYYFKIIYVGLAVPIVFLPIAWVLSHIHFIWPEGLACMIAGLCVAVGMRPYQDYFRAVIVLIIAITLLHCHVTFDATIFDFHIEKYLYYIAIAAALLTLWRRFLNWVCWTQIDRICEKYCLPYYDQKTLMDNYEGYDTSRRKKGYSFYTRKP